MQENEPQPKDEFRKLREELVRLRLKHDESTDKDIRAVLQLRIAQILEEIPPELAAKPLTPKQEEAAKIEIEIEESPTDPPTPAQLAEADKLVIQARVEKMRGNAAKSTEFLKQAAAAAPGSKAVLEALGDNLVERKQFKAAMNAYQKAFRLDPKNVGVEEKLANVALTMGSLGSLDDQMRRNLSDSPFLTEADAYARLPAAVFLSALVPGVGHLVLGKTSQGLTILAGWVISLIWFLSHWFDFVKLISLTSGGREKPNMLVLMPLLLMVGIYIGTLNSLKGRKDVVRKVPAVHPKPPVDLPFD